MLPADWPGASSFHAFARLAAQHEAPAWERVEATTR
jgi:hypothetical protein